VIEIIDEMQYIHKKYGVNNFVFQDPLWTGPRSKKNKNRILDFAEELVRRNLNVHFYVQARIDFFDIESDGYLLKKLCKAGLSSIFLGIENACPETLKRYNKNINPNEIIDQINFLRFYNVFIHIGFIMLHPFVTIEELRDNMKFLRKIGFAHLPHVVCSKLMIYKETDIWRQALDAELLISSEVDGFCEYSYLDESSANAAKKIEKLIDELGTLSCEIDLLETQLWHRNFEYRKLSLELKKKISHLMCKAWDGILRSSTSAEISALLKQNISKVLNETKAKICRINNEKMTVCN